MADGATIKDFFVGVSWKLDESSQQRAQAGINNTAAAIQKLQTALANAQSAMADVGKHFGSIGGGAEKAFGSISQAAEKAGSEAGKSLSGISDKVQSLIKSLVGGGMSGAGGGGGGISSLLQAVGGVGGAFGAWGGAAIAAATTVIYSMERIAKSLDDLGQKAKGTGVAAKTLSQLSDSTQQAIGHMQSLFRTQPGREAQFMSWAAPYLDQIKREMPKADEAVQKHFAGIRALSKMAPYIAAQMGQIWYGWSEEETRRRIANQDREIANIQRIEQTQRFAGLGQAEMNRLTQQGSELGDEFAQAWKSIQTMLLQVFSVLAPILTLIMRLINGLLQGITFLLTPLTYLGKLLDTLLWPINKLLELAQRGTSVFKGLGDAFEFIMTPLTALRGGFDGLVQIFEVARGAAAGLMKVLQPLVWLWEKFQRIKGQPVEGPPDAGEQTSQQGSREAFRDTVYDAARNLWGRVTGGRPQGNLQPVPSFQRGGIVNADLHQGEMVLPQNLSQGLQSMISNQPAMQAAQAMTQRVNAALFAWLSGGARGPKVVIENVQEFWREFLAAQQNAKDRKQRGADAVPGGAAGAAGGAGAAAGGGAGAAGGAAGAVGAAAGGAGGPAAAAGAMAAEGGPLGGDGVSGAAPGDWRTAPREWGPQEQPTTPGGRLGRAAGEAVAGTVDAIDRAQGGSGAVSRDAGFNQRAGDMLTRMQNELGLTKEQAAGFIGNLAHESGGFKTMQEKTSMRGGLGYAQWTGPRRDKFEAFLKSRGVDASDHDANVDFLINELKTSEGGALKALKGAGTVQEASTAAHTSFFRSADVTQPGYHSGVGRVIRPMESAPKRLAEAQKVMGIAGDQVVMSPGAGIGTGAQPVRELGEKGRGPAEAGRVTQAQAGIRKLPLDPKLASAMESSAAAAGVYVKVTSGGQVAAARGGVQGKTRTGTTTRHDEGNAGDVDLFDADGKQIMSGDPRMRTFVRDFVRNNKGAGVGAGKGYMGGNRIHVGFGGDAVWGSDYSAGSAAKWLQEEHAAGVADRKKIMSAQMGGVIPDNILGGIMPLLAHAGEMVLPRELSQGLQRLIGGEGFGAFDRPIGGDTFSNYNQRQITINQTNNHTWANPQAIQSGRFRDVHDRMTGDLVRHFTSAMA